jgi:hypothetical protein
MKPLFAAAAFACLVAPAAAWDADPASFRADPQAWVRNTLMPGCRAPADAATSAQCDCMVPLIAPRITEADVARVNHPDFAKTVFNIAGGAAALCMARK